MIKKIMVIDDFDIIRSNLKRIINQLGVSQVVEAGDGIQAMEKLNLPENEQGVDLIFLDWNMPRMNGFDFLVELKKIDKFKDIPVIITTAERERKSVIAALNAGASDYIVKPFKPRVIREKLEKYQEQKKVA